MRSLKALLVGVLGIAAFTLLASPASGSTIRANSSSYTAVSAGTIVLDPGGLDIRCNLTFTFGLSATSVTAAVLPATLVNFGTVGGRAGACLNGFTVALLNLPWSYDAVVGGGAGNVTGSTRVTIKNFQIQFANTAGTLRCLYAGSVSSAINAAGTAMTVSSSLPLSSGSILCPVPGALGGTLALSLTMVLTLS